MIIGILKMPICCLPHCHERQMLTQMVINDKEFVNVVATMGGDEDWACYIGFPSSMDNILPEKRDYHMEYYVREVSSPEGVANHGDKVSYKTAMEMFPMLDTYLWYRK